MINTYLDMVAEFHRVMKYRQPEPTQPDLSDPATNELRPKLIAEELHELRAAIEANDRLEQLDALCDIQYVLSGAVLAWGLRKQYLHPAITINLCKIPDMDAHLARMLGTVAMMKIDVSRVSTSACISWHLRELQSRLSRFVWHLGFSECFSAAFTEVHRSNMSKQWSEHEVAMHDSNTLPKLHFTLTDGCFFIARRDDGKIIKSPSYSPADLKRFL